MTEEEIEDLLRCADAEGDERVDYEGIIMDKKMTEWAT